MHPDQGVVPSGAIPRGYYVHEVQKGAGHWTVTALGDPKHSSDGGVWLFDANWESRGRGEVTVPGMQLQSISAEWDKSRQQLAVVVWASTRERSVVRVGLLRAPHLKFSQLLSIPDGTWPKLAWSDDNVVVGVRRIDTVTGSATNSVVLVNTTTARSDLICSMPKQPLRRITAMGVYPSPDGRRVALDLEDLPPAETHYGLFLADLAAGGYAQITYEDAPATYQDIVVGWESSDRLLFARVGGGRCDLYRATMRPAER